MTRITTHHVSDHHAVQGTAEDLASAGIRPACDDCGTTSRALLRLDDGGTSRRICATCYAKMEFDE